MAEKEKEPWPVPVLPHHLKQVLEAMAGAIPVDFAKKCRWDDETPYPGRGDQRAKKEHLKTYAGQKLDRIALYEYRLWLNGLMPFVSPREVQLWRLRQFAQYIWDWEIPDDDVLAVSFNLTTRQAKGLVLTFYASFRKTFIFPKILRRIIALFEKVDYKKARVPVKDINGVVVEVPSRRYVDETNIVIDELRDLAPAKRVYYPAQTHLKNRQLMWVSRRVCQDLKEPEIIEQLKENHPIGGGDY